MPTLNAPTLKVHSPANADLDLLDSKTSREMVSHVKMSTNARVTLITAAKTQPAKTLSEDLIAPVTLDSKVLELTAMMSTNVQLVKTTVTPMPHAVTLKVDLNANVILASSETVKLAKMSTNAKRVNTTAQKTPHVSTPAVVSTVPARPVSPRTLMEFAKISMNVPLVPTTATSMPNVLTLSEDSTADVVPQPTFSRTSRVMVSLAKMPTNAKVKTITAIEMLSAPTLLVDSSAHAKPDSSEMVSNVQTTKPLVLQLKDQSTHDPNDPMVVLKKPLSSKSNNKMFKLTWLNSPLSKLL